MTGKNVGSVGTSSSAAGSSLIDSEDQIQEQGGAGLEKTSIAALPKEQAKAAKDIMEQSKQNTSVDQLLGQAGGGRQYPGGGGGAQAAPATTGAPGFQAGMMQITSVFPLPTAVAQAAVQLTDEQKNARAELEKSPAWGALSDAQKTQITKSFSKLSGDKLKGEVTKMQEKFGAIQTLMGEQAWSGLATAQQQKLADQMMKLSGKALTSEVAKTQEKFGAIKDVMGEKAWKELAPAQQQKISDQLLKASGNGLKTETAAIKKKFESIDSLSSRDAWKALSAEQKQKLTDPILTASGQKLANHITETKKRFDSIESLSQGAGWKSLDGTEKQKIAGRILKAPINGLAQTTDNLKTTADYVGSLKDNKVDVQQTLDKLIDLETAGPKSFAAKMAKNLTDAQSVISGAQNKQTAATDTRDMVNFAIDRGIRDRNHTDAVDVKGEIFGRFVKQYKSDPSDFAQVRTQLQQNSGIKLLPHWSSSDRIGTDIGGSSNISQAALQALDRDKNIPAGEQDKFHHGLAILVQNEAKLDGINGYDSGIISVGLRQWTTHQGSLAAPLRQFQQAHPDKFAQLLPGVQVQGDTITYNGKSLTTSAGNSSSSLVSNLKQSEIMELTNKFGALAKDPDFQAIQMGESVDRIRTVRNMSVGSHTIDDYVQSDRALGHVVDFDPNRPAWVQPSFREAVQNVAQEFGLKDAAPSRQELLNALKDKAEKDPDFQARLKSQYGNDILNRLKDAGYRSEFLETRLSTEFRDRFISRENDPKHAQALRDRYTKTENYYDSL